MKYFETKVVKVRGEKLSVCPDNGRAICLTCGEKLYHIEKTEKQPKGNWINGENLDKIKFPCFCSYVSGIGIRYCELDFIDHIAGEKYYRVKELKQCFNNNDHALAIFYNKDLKKLILTLGLKILKGKIIIFEEE